eukprot:m.77764 g.77764  ORF g.77764 m.77764 type:complete len:702 (-) comp12641_c0_seq1:174-2279(-)
MSHTFSLKMSFIISLILILGVLDYGCSESNVADTDEGLVLTVDSGLDVIVRSSATADIKIREIVSDIANLKDDVIKAQRDLAIVNETMQSIMDNLVSKIDSKELVDALENSLAKNVRFADVGDIRTRPSCDTTTAGRAWIDSKKQLSYCAGSADWIKVDLIKPGAKESTPAADCKEYFEFQLAAGYNESDYTTPVWIGQLQPESYKPAHIRMCKGENDLGSDGSIRERAGQSCSFLKHFFTKTDALLWVLNDKQMPVQVYCNAKGEEEGDGLSQNRPVKSCADLYKLNGNTLTPGLYWVGNEQRYCRLNAKGEPVGVGHGKRATDPAPSCDALKTFYKAPAQHDYYVCESEAKMPTTSSATLKYHFKASSKSVELNSDGSFSKWKNEVSGGGDMISGGGKPQFRPATPFGNGNTIPTVHLSDKATIGVQGVALGNKQLTVVMVMNQYSSKVIYEQQWALGSTYVHAPYTRDGPQKSYANWRPTVRDSPQIKRNQFQTYMWVEDGEKCILYMDGVETVTYTGGAAQDWSSPRPFAIGRNLADQTLTADIAEVMLFDAGLSQSDRESVMSYIKEKYEKDKPKVCDSFFHAKVVGLSAYESWNPCSTEEQCKFQCAKNPDCKAVSCNADTCHEYYGAKSIPCRGTIYEGTCEDDPDIIRDGLSNNLFDKWTTWKVHGGPGLCSTANGGDSTVADCDVGRLVKCP